MERDQTHSQSVGGVWWYFTSWQAILNGRICIALMGLSLIYTWSGVCMEMKLHSVDTSNWIWSFVNDSFDRHSADWTSDVQFRTNFGRSIRLTISNVALTRSVSVRRLKLARAMQSCKSTLCWGSMFPFYVLITKILIFLFWGIIVPTWSSSLFLVR